MRHTHRDPNRLTFACSACIHRVERDQFAADISGMATADLLEYVVGRGYVSEWKRQMVEAEMAGRAA